MVEDGGDVLWLISDSQKLRCDGEVEVLEAGMRLLEVKCKEKSLITNLNVRFTCGALSTRRSKTGAMFCDWVSDGQDLRCDGEVEALEAGTRLLGVECTAKLWITNLDVHFVYDGRWQRRCSMVMSVKLKSSGATAR